MSSADQTRFAGTWGYPLTKPLTEHWTTHSVPIILNVYSTLEFVHDIYRSNVQNGPLLWAAHLFSRTYVTNIRYPTSKYTESQEETDRELGVYLSKTLTSVNAALQKPEGAQRNDVLATVWILCNYEVRIPFRPYVTCSHPVAARRHARPCRGLQPLASSCSRLVQYSQGKRHCLALHRSGAHGFLASLQHGGMSIALYLSVPQ